MVDPKVRDLIQRLRDKTRNHEVPWQEATGPGEFHASFPSYTVGLASNEDSITLSIIDGTGRIIETIDERPLRRVDSWDSDLAEALEDLYRSARREAYRVDDAIEELLTQLK